MTQCLGGGVPAAVATTAAATPQHDHHVLWPGANAVDRSGPFTAVHALVPGRLARLRQVAALVAELAPDVVHAHSSWAGVGTRLRPLGVPVVYQPHCFAFETVPAGSLRRRAYRDVERVLGRRGDALVALTPHERTLAERLRTGRPVHLVPGVATVAATGASAPDPGEPPLVVMAGRVCAQKDPGFFAAVAADVRRRAPHVRFRWIGGGEDAAVAGLESAGVEVSGWVRGPALAHEIAAASVHLHSAAWEGFPLSVLDAAALDVPVVARDIPAFHGSGLRTSSGVSGAVQAVLGVLDDPDQRAAAVAAGRELLRRSTPQAHGRALDAVYAAVVGSRPVVVGTPR